MHCKLRNGHNQKYIQELMKEVSTFITNIIYDGIELLKSIMKWGH